MPAGVAVLDATGRELPGFGLADCDTLDGDGACLPVKWKGKSLATVSAEPIRLKFELMNQARLYGCHLENKSGAYTMSAPQLQ